MPISQITGASIQDGSIVVADLGITTFNTGTGNTLTLQANSATGLVISVTGNTAIANSLSFSSTGARITGDFSNATIANRIYFQGNTGSGTDVGTLTVGTSGQSQFSAFNSSDPTNANKATLICNASEMSLRSNIGGTASYIPMTFYTGGSERLRIDTSGNMMLGVTTVSSSTKFDVYGNSSAAHVGARVTNAATDGYSTLWLSSSNDGLVRGGSTAAAFTSELAMLTSGSIPLTFYTTNTKRMTIGATGNIGIGTTSPSQLLHVAAGTILASNTSSATATVSIAGNGSTTGTSDFSLQQGTSSEAYVFNRANSYLVLGTNNAERMRITNSGRVGIFTTSPDTNLTVDTASGPGSTVNQHITFGRGTTVRAYIGTNKDNATDNVSGLVFGIDSTERMRITSGGEVIVGGSTSGGADLTVDGSGGRIACLDTNGGIYFGTTPSGGFSTNGAIARAAVNQYHISGSVAGDLCIAPDGGKSILFGSATSSGIGCSLAARIGSTGDFQFNSGYGSCATAYGCRAWVNFNGTGTVAIRASGNVSSITDNGTGDYTINFSSALVDANYSFTGSLKPPSSFSGNNARDVHVHFNTTPTTSAIRVNTATAGAGYEDYEYVYGAIFR
jgi:hypothetical protein